MPNTKQPEQNKTKKDFREFLNSQDKTKDYKNNQYGQRTRLYGDYLYNQDREKFNWNYESWLKGENL